MDKFRPLYLNKYEFLSIPTHWLVEGYIYMFRTKVHVYQENIIKIVMGCAPRVILYNFWYIKWGRFYDINIFLIFLLFYCY